MDGDFKDKKKLMNYMAIGFGSLILIKIVLGAGGEGGPPNGYNPNMPPPGYSGAGGGRGHLQF